MSLDLKVLQGWDGSEGKLDGFKKNVTFYDFYKSDKEERGDD